MKDQFLAFNVSNMQGKVFTVVNVIKLFWEEI